MQIELDLNPNAFGLDSQPNTKEYLGKWYHDCFTDHSDDAFFVLLSLHVYGYVCTRAEACLSVHAHGDLRQTALSTLSLRKGPQLNPAFSLPVSSIFQALESQAECHNHLAFTWT